MNEITPVPITKKSLGDVLREAADPYMTDNGELIDVEWSDLAQAVANEAIKPYDKAFDYIHAKWMDCVVDLAKANQQNQEIMEALTALRDSVLGSTYSQTPEGERILGVIGGSIIVNQSIWRQVNKAILKGLSK